VGKELSLQSRKYMWEALYEAHADRVLAFALRRVPRDDAQDVVAETFLIAWRRADVMPTNALPWLFGIARNVISNYRRASLRKLSLISKLAATGSSREPESSDSFSEIDGLDLIRTALAQLTDAEREALTLLAWDGLSRREAAAALGCSSTAFALRLYRARRRLCRVLANQNDNLSVVSTAPKRRGDMR
jgi:RNA polymerase sigma-70 factor (ECF subfamily)